MNNDEMDSTRKKKEDVLEEYEEIITILREIYRIIIRETKALMTSMREREREIERKYKNILYCSHEIHRHKACINVKLKLLLIYKYK